MSIDALGDQLARRLWGVNRPSFFDALQPKDYGDALRHAVIAGARTYARKNIPKHIHLADNPVVEEDLVSELRERLQRTLAATNAEPSMSAVTQSTQRLGYKTVFQDAIARGADALVLDRRILP